ncbi:protein canopy-1-like, partial [Entelurus aequoreus]|uniref:protein canopy-1-like n=1 Tax=Entelurus aequoreus TaxID=161455 RepID=UPI002B1DA664
MAPCMVDMMMMLMMLMVVFICCCQAKRDQTLYCSACRAVVDELKHSISQVDPKKTINVGSFRLQPDGSMTDKKMQSRSKNSDNRDSYQEDFDFVNRRRCN